MLCVWLADKSIEKFYFHLYWAICQMPRNPAQNCADPTQRHYIWMVTPLTPTDEWGFAQWY